MGIRGLKTYVFDHKESLMKEHRLSNQTLIVDGQNFALKNSGYMKMRDAFGGDYPDIHSHFVQLIGNLLKCGVSPIVVFDGVPSKSKLKMKNFSRNVMLQVLKGPHVKESSGVFHPLFMIEEFMEVLDDMNVQHVTLYEEATREIVALAKFLNCSVLSDNSYFFVQDVDYIPLDTVDFSPRSNPDGSLFCHCLLYKSEHLLNEFPGLRRLVLPLAGIVLGNDYVKRKFISGFLDKESKDPVGDVLRKLQTAADVDNAVKEILRSLNVKDAEERGAAIEEVLVRYNVPQSMSSGCRSVFGPDVLIRMPCDSEPKVYGRLLSDVPREILELHENGKASSILMRLIVDQYLHVGIEFGDIKQLSPHFPSLPIIQKIYGILRAVIGGPEQIKVNMRVRGLLSDATLVCRDQNNISRDVLRQGEGNRRRVFCDALGLNENDRILLNKFDKDWTIFVASIIYWARSVENLTVLHLRAVLLTALCNYVKSGDGCRRRGSASARASRSFSDLVERVPEEEYQKFVDTCSILGKSEEDILEQDWFFTAVHIFMSLQCVVFYVKQLNNLLNSPFHDCRMSNLYSGTFLFTLFFILTERLDFEEDELAQLPNMSKAYNFLKDSLSTRCFRRK